MSRCRVVRVSLWDEGRRGEVIMGTRDVYKVGECHYD